MPDPITPALTAKRWAELRSMPLSIAVEEAPDWLTAARLILADSDSGFTREDVAALRDLMGNDYIRTSPGYERVEGRLASLASRIEALLPPETP